MNYLYAFTPTLDRDAGEEKVWGRQNEEDLDEGTEPPLKTHRRETDKPGSINICK